MKNNKDAKSTKVTIKYFCFSWIINIIFSIIIGTQKIFGNLSLFAFIMLTISLILSAYITLYFVKEIRVTSNQTPYQVIKEANKWLILPILLIFILLFTILIL